MGDRLGVTGLLATLAVAVLLAAALVRWVAVAPGGHAPAAAAPTAAATLRQDGFAVWALRDDGTPVRWDPCTPIAWVLNPDGAPPRVEADLHAAVAQVEAATGLRFSFEGATSEQPSRERRLHQPERYGDRWAPVLIAWMPPADTSIPIPMDHDVRGAAVPVAVQAGDRHAFVTGQIVLNPDRPLAPGFGERHGSWGAVFLHELGHLVGLDHVADPAQLLHPTPGAGPSRFGDGDLRGLRALGAAGGCVEIPEPRDLEVVYRDAG